jgi:tripartite-type tricarboxylate transporter receptor subunit TctC
MTRLRTFLLLAAFVLGWISPAFAQAYPEKPITIVTAFGGGGEQLYRVLAKRMSELLGQPIVIIPEPGAAGVLAASRVARAAPDGYTLLAGNTGSHILRPLAAKATNYDPIRDFSPISQVTEPVFVVAINPALPIHNLRELVEYARRTPGETFLSVGGTGSVSDLSVLLLRNAGIPSLRSVSYRDDNQPLIDASAGRVSGTIGPASSVRRFVQSGGLRAIGVLTDQRRPEWEGVATVSEQIPGFRSLQGFTGLFGPSGLPRNVVVQLNQAVAKALADPEVNRTILGFGSNPRASTPEQLAELIKGEIERTGAVLKEAGVKLE